LGIWRLITVSRPLQRKNAGGKQSYLRGVLSDQHSLIEYLLRQ
jgi:hypothetical protein